ncbi:PAS domain-containing protein [Mesorhizobium sp. M3A.F.Ca.ET.174.01.1.1]|uniref:HWE histidine kinase domain-containing protein n=1 Tax=unclassified Mesorhizobium TaxID=325217 RepID=UPI001093D4F1|nr:MULTISPECIES: HWE histidine kinase domain-containing protein [unclassified Mesorhizobium]TGS71519.1 PAS domain-containing protein [Mesorhizobium sp. M3A.F.Ca.ET.201.01.1.1]TGS82380.1 PAS domain-containing protein [Mesorhizobium sp. M3A.F.Ca.ET.175.01.1.1]TGT22202.1 PAS domain-containing protein [Mesorhizobium sp. M3A.F.Ca.ET.174.01.1.1]
MNLEDLYRILRTGHVQAQGIVDTVPDPLLVLDAGLTVQSANRSFIKTFAVERYETIGQHLYELGNGQWDIPELRRLLSDVIPRSTAVIDYKVEHEFPDIGKKTMLVTARTLFSPDDVSHVMLLSIVDATERSRKAEEFEAIFSELRHRMKNLLGLVRALANQTRAEGISGEEYRDAFLGRLDAIVEANDLSLKDHGEDSLEALVARATRGFQSSPEAIRVEPGTPVTLASKEIMSLSLVLHELATNAVKYGALSVPAGQVDIRWLLEDGNALRITWSERGGPSVAEPTSTGYGTQLIQFAIAYNLGGRVEQTYHPGGLEAQIVIPLERAARPD